MKTRTEKFDCVRMKHEGAGRVQEMLRGMTTEEQLAYWERRYQEIAKEQKARRKQS